MGSGEVSFSSPFVSFSNFDKSLMMVKEQTKVYDHVWDKPHVVKKKLEFILIFLMFFSLPRLQQFIINQEWNDPKSKLQQCCLTLRTIDGGEPDIPVYKVKNDEFFKFWQKL